MLGGGDNALTLPEQASNIRLQSSETPQEIFRNNLDALVDEPWGGVINTGSRLIRSVSPGVRLPIIKVPPLTTFVR